jgi:site-specific DNA-methyltransferase (adenine-specific)
MKAYRKTDNYTLYLADAWEVLDSLPENSIDAVVTDPPYHLTSIVKRFGKEGSAPASTKNNDGSFARLSKGFMGKEWDGVDENGMGVAFDRTTWEKVLRVLKPGGHILAFNHSRTFHRMAVAIEDAGFEIRDTIMWLYGSGFPKSHDISKAIDRQAGVEREVVGIKDKKPPATNLYGDYGENNNYDITTPATEEAKQWEGWGTALKPAYEPILLARKPIPTTVADNVLTHRVGGLNIDECRVESEPELAKNWQRNQSQSAKDGGVAMNKSFDTIDLSGYTPNGRFPANIIHDGSEEVVDGFPETVTGSIKPHQQNSQSDSFGMKDNFITGSHLGDSGSASRFFYTAKASKKDRDDGLFRDAITVGDGRNKSIDNAFQRGETPRRNIHPTVKPTDLMQYLIRLIAPKGATVLDIFMGSGSTGKAAMIENVERDANYHFIGIDRTEEYMPIAEARIEFGLHYLAEKPKADGVVHTDQIDLFSLL